MCVSVCVSLWTLLISRSMTGLIKSSSLNYIATFIGLNCLFPTLIGSGSGCMLTVILSHTADLKNMLFESLLCFILLYLLIEVASVVLTH